MVDNIILLIWIVIGIIQLMQYAQYNKYIKTHQHSYMRDREEAKCVYLNYLFIWITLIAILIK